MTTDTRDTSSFTSSRTLLGLGLVIVGIVLLLDRVHAVNAHVILRFWPLALIAYGVQQFFTPRPGLHGERVFPTVAVIWMAVGGLFLLNSLGIMRVSVWSLVWPAILIAVGIRLMNGSQRGLRTNIRAIYTELTSGTDVGSVIAILGGVKRVSAPVAFSGSDVTVFMGGAQVDLRSAKLERGQEAVIDLFAVMGGCELLVPPHWTVSAPVMAIMGGVDDKRHVAPPAVIDQTMDSAPPPRLVIRGLVFLSGATLRT